MGNLNSVISSLPAYSCVSNEINSSGQTGTKGPTVENLYCQKKLCPVSKRINSGVDFSPLTQKAFNAFINSHGKYLLV